MKKLVHALAVGALLVSATSAVAQPGPRDAGVFKDLAGTQSTYQVPPFVQFEIYAIGFDLDGLVKGFEFSVSGFTGLFLLGSSFNGSLNFGDVPGEFIVGTGGCLDGAGAFRMATLILGDFSSATGLDRAICLGQSRPTSFPLEPGNSAGPGLPGYLQCDGTLVPFGVAQNGGDNYPDGCLILNATQVGPISGEATSFGEMKARF